MPLSRGSKFRLVPIDQLSRYTPKTSQTQYWIDFFTSIPEGQALMTTEEELGVKAATIVSKVIDYQKKGWIPKGFKVRQKRQGETRNVFILHESVKEQKGGSE